MKPAMKAPFKLLLSVLFVLSCSVHAQTFSKESIAVLDQYLEQAIATTHIPGLVALVTSKDSIIYESAYGKMDVANNKAMTTDTIFRLASMTKPVTSVAVMMLEEEGRVNLDDPIADYLPELANREVFTSFNLENGSYTSAPAKNEITIRHLLTHTSGLGYAFSSPVLAKAMGFDRNSIATDHPLLHEPGEKWTYGESTRGLGLLVEKISGQDLYAFMRERIFSPLDMDDMFFVIPADKVARTVTVHQSDGQMMVEQANPDVISFPVRGDGGLSGTASDYSKFIRLILNGGSLGHSGQLLRTQTVELLGQNHTGKVKVELMPIANPSRSKPFPLGAGIDTYGLGFQVTGSQIPDMRSPGSMAWAGIYNTEFWIDPEKEIGAVLLMQVLPFYDEAAIEVLQGFEKRVYQNLEY
jgi:CubicO group peptidase (beta-lactamase class C family)